MSSLKKKGPSLARRAEAAIKKTRRTLGPEPVAPERKPLSPGDLLPGEASVVAELDEVQSSFRARQKQESSRFINVTDSEYWVALCFQTREQKEEFLEKLGLINLGDKYLDGLKVAERLDVEIESPTPKMPKLRTDRKLKVLAMPLE